MSVKQKIKGLVPVLLILIILCLCSCDRIKVGELYLDELFTMFSGTEASAEITEPDYVDYTVTRVHYESLSQTQRKAYRGIYNSVFAHPEKIFIPLITEEELSDVFNALVSDNPHLLCMGHTYSYFSVGNRMCFLPQYVSDAAHCDEASRQTVSAAKEICRGLPPESDDFARELYVHDILIDGTRYQTGGDCETAYGALVKHKAQCSGYALAFKLLLDVAGVQCFTVEGNATDSSNETGLHMWNCVNVDGEWYFTDPTWNDPTNAGEQDIARHNYFNVTKDFLSKTHRDYSLPDGVNCTSDRDNYFIRNGLYCTAESYESILTVQLEKLGQVPCHLELRMSDGELMKKAVETLFEKDGFSRMLSRSARDWDGVKIFYTEDTLSSVIQIFFEKEG